MVSINSFLTASLLSLAAADFAGDVSAVISNAQALSSVAGGWSAGDGLVGALNIQASYGPLSDAVVALQGDAGSVSQSDVTGNTDGINNLASSVAALLNVLVSKANDLSSVGASSIVTNDINGLSGPAADIIKKLLAVNSDSSALDAVKGNVNSLADAFTDAISAFSASSVDFPHV